MSKAAATTVEERLAEMDNRMAKLKAEMAALEQMKQSNVSMEELDEIHDLLCHMNHVSTWPNSGDYCTYRKESNGDNAILGKAHQEWLIEAQRVEFPIESMEELVRVMKNIRDGM